MHITKNDQKQCNLSSWRLSMNELWQIWRVPTAVWLPKSFNIVNCAKLMEVYLSKMWTPDDVPIDKLCYTDC